MGTCTWDASLSLGLGWRVLLRPFTVTLLVPLLVYAGAECKCYILSPSLFSFIQGFIVRTELLSSVFLWVFSPNILCEHCCSASSLVWILCVHACSSSSLSKCPVLWSVLYSLSSVSLVRASRLVPFGCKRDLLGEQPKKIIFPYSEDMHAHLIPLPGFCPSYSSWNTSTRFLIQNLPVQRPVILFYPFRFVDFILKRCYSLVGTFSQPWGHLTAGQAGETQLEFSTSTWVLSAFQIISIKISQFCLFVCWWIQLYWKKKIKLPNFI